MYLSTTDVSSFSLAFEFLNGVLTAGAGGNVPYTGINTGQKTELWSRWVSWLVPLIKMVIRRHSSMFFRRFSVTE